RGPAPPPPPHR
nr:Chain C, Proline-rich protein LAS17 [synthetic construct]